MKQVLMVIKNLEARIIEAEEKLFCLSTVLGVPEMDGMPKGNVAESSVEKLAVTLAELREEIRTLRTTQVACRIELFEWLGERISSPAIVKILLFRYGFLKKFSEIAELVNFSEQSVFRLHREGLKKLGIRAKVSADYEFDK